MSSVLVVVRRNFGETYKAGTQIGFMEEGFDTEVLKSRTFGLSITEFFQLIHFSPKRAMKLFPSCFICTDPKKNHEAMLRSVKGWKEIRWLRVWFRGDEFQQLADIVGMPVHDYRNEKDETGRGRTVWLTSISNPGAKDVEK